MFIQLFRNKVYESRKFKNALRRLDKYIAQNKSSLREEQLIAGLANQWKQQNRIFLKDFNIRGKKYSFFADFFQIKTHGHPYLSVDDQVSLASQNIEFKTEFGDLALIVDYRFDNKLISRKLSIIQSKKELSANQAQIAIHQLYLMQFWPNIQINNRVFDFRHIENPDKFAFYHFILNKHNNPRYSSSICSAPYIALNLGKSKIDLENDLVAWCQKRRVNNKEPPPHEILSMPLVPGQIYNHGKSYEWNKLARPFYNFLLDAAYQNIGTNDLNLLKIASLRIPNILALQVTGTAGDNEFRSIDDLFYGEIGSDDDDKIIFT